MFDFYRRGWHWQLTSPEDWQHFQDLSRNLPEPVKQNAARKVYRLGPFYWKVHCQASLANAAGKLFLGSKARREFQSFLTLSRLGIPVVEHVGFGEKFCSSDSALLTRAWEPSESVTDYYLRDFVLKGQNPAEFLDKFSRFLAVLMQAPVYHPDLHGGNILYSAEKNAFVLVDVYKVRACRFRSRRQLNDMRRIVFEFRELLEDAALEKLLIQSCCASGEYAASYVREGLLHEAELVRKDWERRRKQLLSGYPKYCVCCRISGVNYAFRRYPTIVPGDASILNSCRRLECSPEEALQRWCESLLLDLAHLPHRRLIALSEKGICYELPEVPCLLSPETVKNRRRMIRPLE